MSRAAQIQAATLAELQQDAGLLRDLMAAAVDARDGNLAAKWYAHLDRTEKELRARQRAADLAAIEDPMEHARAARDLAIADGSHVAARQWGQRVEELEAALASAAQEQEAGPLDLSPEEWADRVRADAAAASLADLDLYAVEWLRRVGYRLVKDDEGVLSLERAE